MTTETKVMSPKISFHIPDVIQAPKTIVLFEPDPKPKEESDDWLFVGKSLDPVKLTIKDMDLPPLSAESENKLGKQILSSKLALRSLQSISHLLPKKEGQEAWSMLEKPLNKELLKALDTSLINYSNPSEEGNDNSTRLFIDLINDNDLEIKDKINEFSSISNENIRENLITKYFNDLTHTIIQGNEAFHLLINSNLRLVFSKAKRAAERIREEGKGDWMLDFNSAGRVGLVKAALFFNPLKETKFSTYATQWIKQSIWTTARDETVNVRISASTISLLNRLDREYSQYLQNTIKIKGNPMSFEEFVNIYTTKEQAKNISKAINFSNIVSLNTSIRNDDNESQELGELICDENKHLESEVIDDLISRQIKSKIRHYVEKILTEEEKEIVTLYFGLNGEKPKTQGEIGAIMQKNRGKVQMPLRRAFKKLRQIDELAKLLYF